MTRTTKRTLLHSVSELTNSAVASSVLLTRAASKRKNDSQRDAVPIRSGHCSGCSVRIPSAQLQRALAGKTIQCEHCHRVLCVERLEQVRH
jgi:predicted  nucleic acid-binding Zn-ribbon protein